MMAGGGDLPRIEKEKVLVTGYHGDYVRIGAKSFIPHPTAYFLP